MTRPMTRGDIFRQQAIRCARAVFAAARDEAAARRRPPRPNRTSSSFGVGCDFTPAPPNRRFSCRAPPPTSVRAMPAPPFLLGLGAGASLAVKTVGETSGGKEGGKPSRSSKSKSGMVVKPKPFVRPTARPADPCPECDGGGKVACQRCLGRGRTNFLNQAMLPKTVWPEWCAHCRGSGRVHCARCQGQGNFRAKIGFDVAGE